MLLKEETTRDVFAKNYVKKRHTLRFVIIDNQKSCCENAQKEFKEQKNESIDEKENSIKS
jgi:hypothetical protein